MARKVKFPLKLADGTEARTLDELREHFDSESVVGYFHDGRLLTWLRSRYYDDAVKDHPGTVEIGGVVAHKGSDETTILAGGDFPCKGTSTLYGLYLKGFSGETTLMYRTDILKKYPFPEIEGEKYVPEDYIYDKIDGICVLAVLPKVVTICVITDEGYTQSVGKLKRENVNAFYLYYEQRAFITPPGMLKLKYLGRYVIYAKRSGHPVFRDTRLKTSDVILGCIYGGFLLLLNRE